MEIEEYPTRRSDIASKIVNGELLLHDKITSRGRIWRIFSRVKNLEGVELDFVSCKFCEKVHKYNHTQTSNLCRHSCYVERFANMDNEVSIVEEEKPKILFPDVPANNLTQLLTKFIIHNQYPADLLQREDLKAIFQEVLKLGEKFGCDLDLGKLMPSLSKVSDNISDVYNRLHVSIKEEIFSVKENGFGLTADIFTDDLSKENYLTLTMHYLKNSVLTYRLLGFQILEGVPITDSGAIIKCILEEFDLQLTKICLFVTDPSHNFLKNCQDSQNLPCIIQLINKSILGAVEKTPQVSQAINSCFKLVYLLDKKSPNDLTSKFSYKGHHIYSLRIYKMLNSILIHLNEIEQVLQDINTTQISIIDKDKLMAITSILQPFEEAIETLQDNKHATLHLVMPYMHELKKFCQTTKDEYKYLKFIQQFQDNICLNLDEMVIKNTQILHKLAVFLYPPANKLLPYSNKEKKCIEDECIRLMKYYEMETKPLIKQEVEEQQPPNSTCKRRKLLADFLVSETHNDPNEIIRCEIQNYKNTCVAFSSTFNVFNWWESQKNNFPLLYKLSCSVLATPATNAASKHIIINAKNLLSQKYRQNSTDANIEKIIFVNNNAPGVELDRYFSS